MIELLLTSGSNKSPVNDFVLTQTSADEKIPWIVPDGVESICVVCVGHGALGGGGLAWRNNIPVIPGESFYIHFRVWTTQFDGLTGLYRDENTPLCRAIAGRWAERNNTVSFYVLGGNGGKSSHAINDGGGSGGRGHRSGTGRYAGGGAGGYLSDSFLGKGGDAAPDTNTSTVGGANSGSGSGGRSLGNSKGGGVGLYGIGLTGGNGRVVSPYNGQDGSPADVMCGGGGYGVTSDFNGGIRIIWGEGYSYPYNAV